MKKVMVACEESQAVVKAFRALGLEAYSFDIRSCSGDCPQWHVVGDCTPYINGNCTFSTMDGVEHSINGKWDMIIAFPPCTYITKASSVRMFPHGELNKERFERALNAKAFFELFLNADCEHVAIENPTPLKIVGLPKETQAIQPWQFGHPFTKRTCLWLKGLPLLTPTKVVTENIRSWVNGGSHSNGIAHNAVTRSKTFEGVAMAMATQWGVI